jgi:hypothetical protein
MAAHSFLFGHAVTWDEANDTYRYTDTGEVADNSRPCPKCMECPRSDDHDPCIAELPGVIGACCGHGIERGFVVFADGRLIRGEFTIEREEA